MRLHANKNETANRVHRSRRWARLSRQARSACPLCVSPFGLHPPGAALVNSVHHIAPLVDHPEHAFRRANLWPLCDACHTRAETLTRRGIPLCARLLRFRHDLVISGVMRDTNPNFDKFFTRSDLQDFYKIFTRVGESPPLPSRSDPSPRGGCELKTHPLETVPPVKSSARDLPPGTPSGCYKIRPDQYYCCRRECIQRSRCGACENK